MDIQAEKLKIIGDIILTHDESIICKVRDLFHNKNGQYPNEENDGEARIVLALQESEADFKTGNIHSHEKVGEHIRARIAEAE
jgi:hypothetical protein